jgi:tripartite-type tricarboxylate transporter receptor subunit TctC
VSKPILAKLNADIVKALHSPEVRERLAGDGGEAVGNSAQEFRAHIQSEIAMWAKVVKAAGLKPE